MRRIRVGTRGSLLARVQTEQTLQELASRHADSGGLEIETVIIKTTGDLRQNVPFQQVGTKGMFVKELEEALLRGEIDVAIHSLKDMPGELADGLALASVPERADPRDAYLSPGPSLRELSPGARIGTSSLRRQIQLRALRPDLLFDELRGNLDTRLRKMMEGEYAAIILACAGLERLGWSDRITERLSIEECTPAPGQGALALECRDDDTATMEILAALHHLPTADATDAERAFQAALNAGCSVPAGAYAFAPEEGLVEVVAFLSESDGSNIRRVRERGPRQEAKSMGRRAAERVIAG